MENTNPEWILFKKIAKYSIGGILLLLLVLGSFVTVATGELGVKTRLGKVIGVVEPGLHGKLPFIERVERIDVRTRVIKNEHYVNEKGETVSDNALSAASSDLQEVQVSTAVNYHIDQTHILDIYREYKTADRYEEGVIKPLVKQIVKTVSAQYSANELVTKRAEVNAKAEEALRLEVGGKYAVLDQGNITNIEFSPSFTQSIEKKVTAEQDALAAKNRLEQTKYEGEQKIVSARAEAEAIKIQSQAISSQGGADYVQLQAIQKWNGELPTQMIPGSTVPFINLKN